MSSSSKIKYSSWYMGEKKIQEEINWLRNSIETFSNEEKGAPITCRECLIRKIAMLIVSGEVKATEITKNSLLKNFWGIKKGINIKNKENRVKIRHGGDWHRETMKQIENHFLSRGYEVIREPTLFWGRADLGMYKKDKQDLLIEVGTTSFFKLLVNLKMMKNFVYLIAPNDDKLIEFICSEKLTKKNR